MNVQRVLYVKVTHLSYCVYVLYFTSLPKGTRENPNLSSFTLLNLSISQPDLVNNKWRLICSDLRLEVF